MHVFLVTYYFRVWRIQIRKVPALYLFHFAVIDDLNFAHVNKILFGKNP